MSEETQETKPKTTRKKRVQKNKVGEKATTVKNQTLEDHSKGGTIKYRYDFPTWEAYNAYDGKKA